jgi:hypothetical protein
MGRILDARGDEALDVLAELLEPVGNIAKDPEISGKMRTGGGGTILEFIASLLKTHKEDVIAIMALDDGVTVEEERRFVTALTIPGRLIRLIKTPVVHELLFGSAATNDPANGSSAASGSGNG